LAAEVLRRIDAQARCTVKVNEGQSVPAGTVVAVLEGDVRGILTAERTMLNFVMRLSGIATQARRAVECIPPDCRARIYDTRKTLPGWRQLDKAAVKLGGAENHRMGLWDAVLIKDNHVAAAGSIGAAVRLARAANPGLTIEVEVDTFAQLDEALAAGPDIILLDNFDEAALTKAVGIVAGRCLTEASGGVTLQRLPAIARTGVDHISMGALTHTVVPPDMGLDFVS
jgi:nicotinate-nucleotide pyrophosphorylase (carboxylating)